MNKQKIVMSLSGGMDSCTLAALAIDKGYEVHAVSFNYGQKHSKELEAAKEFCKANAITHKVVDITSINSLLSGSTLTDGTAAPEGHYEEESMKSTVVPNRNAILGNLCIGYAASIGASEVWMGTHAGDHAIYPDCRPEFISAMDALAKFSGWNDPITVKAPFLFSDKGGIAKTGLALGVDYSKTWTCYNGREKACGKCGACQERLEAFASCNATDPLAYE